MELGSNEAVKRAVRAGLGVGLLSRLAVQEAIEVGWLVQVRSAFPSLKRTLALARHRHRKLGPIAESFISSLGSTLENSSNPIHFWREMA